MMQAGQPLHLLAHRIRPAEKCDIPAVVGLWVELNRLHSENDLVVAVGCRRRGIGKDLVAAACDWLRSRDLPRAEVFVASANPASMAFWTKLGLVPYLEKRALLLSAEPLPSQCSAGGGLPLGEEHE